VARERIGTAFVRILADGDDFGRSVRDQLVDADDHFADGGKQNAKAYAEGFSEETKKNREVEKSLIRSVEKAFGAISADRELLGRGFERNIANQVTGGLRRAGMDTEIQDRAKEIGERVAKNVVDGFARTGRLPDMTQTLQAQIQRAYDDIIRDEKAFQATLDKLEDEAYAENAKRDRQELERQKAAAAARLKQKRAEYALSRKIEDEAYAEDQERAERAHRERLEFERDFYNEMGKIDKATRQIVGNLNREFVKLDDSLNRTRRSLIPLSSELGAQAKHFRDVTTEIRKQHELLPRFNRGWGRFADLIGASVGRGSRNNFLNFMGSMARNVTNLVGLVPRLVLSFGNFVGDVARAGKQATGFFASIGAMAMEAGLTIGKVLLKSIAGVAVALVTMFVAIGPVVSIFSMLLGVITAISSSIAFGLIGAIVAVAGAMVPLAAIIGAAVIGFNGLAGVLKDKVTRDFKAAGRAASGLRDTLAKNMFANTEEQGRRLARVLEGMRPLSRRVGEAMSHIMDDFINSLDSPGFRNWRDEMTKWLPGAMETLGRSIRQLGGGLGGAFLAATPLIDRFLKWLDKVTKKFETFANSPEGQKKMKKFFDDAGDSAKQVGITLGELSGLLGTIFGQSKPSGDSMLERLGKTFDRWDKWLEDHPDAIKEWAEDAEDFAIDLGNAAVSLGEILDKLDNFFSRKSVQEALEFMEWAFESIAKELGEINEEFSKVEEKVQKVSDWFKNIEFNAPDFSDWDVPGLTFDVNPPDFSGVFRLFERVGKAWEGIEFNAPDTSGILKAFSKVGERVDKIRERIRKFRDNPLTIPGVSTVVGWLDRIQRGVERVRTRVQEMRRNPLTIPGVATVLNWLDRIRTRLGWVRDLISGIRRDGFSLPGIGGAAAAFFPLLGRIEAVRSAIGGISSAVEWLITQIGKIDWPSPPGWFSKIPGLTADGGIFAGAQARIIGEEGPEAVVPLNRPLSQVDPAVRWLSAIAQGLSPIGTDGGGGGVSRQINVGGMTVVSPNSDPKAVAAEVVSRLVATAY
jgi:hypothetical protein